MLLFVRVCRVHFIYCFFVLQQIESYFKAQHLEGFLIEMREIFAQTNDGGNVKLLAIEKRRQLIRHLVDFMVSTFGTKPSAYQKNSTARATIMLFPFFNCKNSKIGGIVRTKIPHIVRLKMLFVLI